MAGSPLDGLLATSRFPFSGHFVQILEHKHPSGWDIVPDAKHKEYGLSTSADMIVVTN